MPKCLAYKHLNCLIKIMTVTLILDTKKKEKIATTKN